MYFKLFVVPNNICIPVEKYMKLSEPARLHMIVKHSFPLKNITINTGYCWSARAENWNRLKKFTANNIWLKCLNTQLGEPNNKSSQSC